MNGYRRPAVAGLFYPSNPVRLHNEINNLLSAGNPEALTGKIFGIIAPHAGYIYSGKTAAFAYNLLKGRHIRKVIILSPSHREFFSGSCIYDGEGYLTPFGRLEIDKETAELMAQKSDSVFIGKEGHSKEHAVEVHLPFLQEVLKDFKIIPVVMGDQEKKIVDDLANAIAAVYDEETIIVASSDLSHFYSREAASKLDSLLEEDIIKFDHEKLLKDIAQKKCEACGGGAIAALMKAADLKGIRKVKVLHRSDSGDVSGDINEVVGYLSAVIYGD
jgi:MEMO1 family protein